MTNLVFESMDKAYTSLYEHVFKYGVKRSPRGLECLEIRPAYFVIRDPRRGIYSGKSRNLNYRFWAVEFLTYLAGWGPSPTEAEGRIHAELMVRVNSKMSAFLNDRGTFDGAYGSRLVGQLPVIVQTLTQDPDSRQALASIWSPMTKRVSKDVPCTVALQYYDMSLVPKQYHTLGASTYMRSNDLNWGTPYDVGAFCALQSLIADCLGWMRGTYSHFAGSLHYYTASPPNISSDETFNNLIEIPLYITHLRGAEALMSAQILADELLLALHQHSCVLLKPWEEFEFLGEKMESGDAWKYWNYWCHLIRTRGRTNE